MNLKFILMFISLPYLLFAQDQIKNENQIIQSLEKIDPSPISIRFSNSLKMNNEGGHIQGIQYLKYDQNDYYILTGSSYSYSYYSILKKGTKNNILSINKILDKPFKHAGGFQIHNNLMAIGIEDNLEKNRSKIFVFSIENPEKPLAKPINIIDRIGPYKRATAGCVGITEIKDYILIIVGDWDTKNLDFYRIKKNNIGLNSEVFELVFSIETNKMDRSDWIDKNWMAYQNINFIQDSYGNLYLVGMASGLNKNILDLYHVQTSDLTKFKLIKIYTKSLSITEHSDFQASAGIRISEDNEIRIISCDSHIQQEFTVNIYK